MRALTKIVLITGLLFILGNSSFSQPKKPSVAAPKTKAFSAREIAEKFLPSVVLIVCDDGKGTVSQGSGFFLADGKLLTNYHVIERMVRGKVKVAVGGKNSSEWWISRVEAFDKDNDIALLSVQMKRDTLDLTGPVPKTQVGTRTPPPPKGLSFSTLDRIKAGEDIYVLSNPKGLTGTISRGIVSGEIRKVKGIDLLQIDAPISSGSSGGAVLNTGGEVVGIATGSFKEGQNLNFAVPVASIRSVLKTYEASKSKVKYLTTTVPNGWVISRHEPDADSTNQSKTDLYEGLTAELQKSLNIPRVGYKDTAERVIAAKFSGCYITIQTNRGEPTKQNKTYFFNLTKVRDVNATIAVSINLNFDDEVTELIESGPESGEPVSLKTKQINIPVGNLGVAETGRIMTMFTNLKEVCNTGLR